MDTFDIALAQAYAYAAAREDAGYETPYVEYTTYQRFTARVRVEELTIEDFRAAYDAVLSQVKKEDTNR